MVRTARVFLTDKATTAKNMERESYIHHILRLITSLCSTCIEKVKSPLDEEIGSGGYRNARQSAMLNCGALGMIGLWGTVQ